MTLLWHSYQDHEKFDEIPTETLFISSHDTFDHNIIEKLNAAVYL